MTEKDWAPKWWWAAPAAGFLVLLLLCMLIARPAPQRNLTSSSYDATPHGVRAAFLLLEELNYPVVRSKQLAGGPVKWVLFPTFAEQDVDTLDRWVRDGGVLLLADNSTEFARHLGITLAVRDTPAGASGAAASGLGVSRLVGGETHVEWPGHRGRVVVSAAGQPFVTVYGHGRGEIWLANRPEFLQNEWIGKADNGVLVCRLAEAMLQDRSGKLAFDEYFHGMRDRPGVVQLLLEPPALWVTLEGALIAAVLLWHYLPRFGTLRPPPPSRRRSKEEFLDAMASLLERKADYAEAYNTVRNDWLREIEQDLGLPTNTPQERLIAEAARRRGVDANALARVLSPACVTSATRPAAFVKALNDLETCRNEFCHGRHHR